MRHCTGNDPDKEEKCRQDVNRLTPIELNLPSASTPTSAFSTSCGRRAEKETTSSSNGVELPNPSYDLVSGVSSSLNVGDTERPDMALVGGAHNVGDVKTKDLETRRLRWLPVVSRR